MHARGKVNRTAYSHLGNDEGESTNRIIQQPSVLGRFRRIELMAEAEELLLRFESFTVDHLDHRVDPLRIGVEAESQHAMIHCPHDKLLW